ncbi:hypothetical protein ACIBG8_20085 [Nonomuraea sp. NPDC050556]|uniref:hypothetical protein n=1 Tax=Nonomuraea sp. NPDC050556 TaxID=3364369 RepID=UPI0037880E5D
MLAFALGLAWLVLGPLALWVVVRGRNPARVGAVLTLALLEAGTIWLNDNRQAAPPVMAVASHVVAAPAPVSCAERIPVPERARMGAHHDSLTLSWAAAPQECGTAKVVLRHKGAKIRVWIHEGPLKGVHSGVRTLPVHVADGTASLRVSLDLPSRPRYLPIDGRSGHKIPSA